MKIRCNLILILILVFTTKITAQTISGIISDKTNHEPIEFANIVLLKSDSTFYKGTISNEIGYFEFKDIIHESYIIKVSCLGYDEKIMIYQTGITHNDKLNIFLNSSSQMLNEIVVTGNNPFFKMINGGLITNVSTTALSNLGTANDVLQRIPGIITIDDNLSVFGKGSPLIYINNRLIKDQSEIERVLSSEISTIELITNPDSRYDAEGRAVLIIKTKKKQSGWAMNISERLTQGKYLGDAENINLSFANNNINVFASYYHGYQKSKTDELNLFNVDSKKQWEHTIKSPYYYSYHLNQLSGGFDWSVNEKHNLGIEYQYYFEKANNDMYVDGTSLLDNVLYDNFTSTSLIKEKPYRHLVNGFYNIVFNEKFSLNFNFDYIKNRTERHQNTTEFSNIENREVNTHSQSDFNLYAAKILLEYKSDIGSFIAGGEYNNISGDGFILNKESVINENRFENLEEKIALFANYSTIIKKFKLDAGLRYEYANDKNVEGYDKRVVSNRKYHNLYPNLSVSRSFNDLSLSFQLNRRVQRPSFAEINDNVIYINRLVLQKGNPNLKEVDIYSINLQLMYKKFYANLGYTYQKNPIALFNEYDDNSYSIYVYTKNYPKYKQISLMTNYRDRIKFWNVNYSLGITQPSFSFFYNNKKMKYNNPSVILRTYNDFILPNNLTLSLNYTYQSENIYYTMQRNYYNRFDIGIRKSFFNNSLKLNLEARDIFNGVKERNIININNVSFIQKKNRETRVVILSINYLFNNYNKKYRGSHVSYDDINRL